MYFIICIVSCSLMCAMANIHNCKRLKDEIFPAIPEKYFKIVSEDTLNVTRHNDEYVAMLRETLKNDNLPPDTVKYYLFTSRRHKKPFTINLTKGCFKKIPYNNKKPLAFGIHGYATQINFTEGLVGDLVQAVVNLNKYNVIFADYTNASDSPLLSAVIPKAYLAAKSMAKFLHFLMRETGTRREQIHVIGHSLGGQMASIVGGLLPGLGRITGLEPGGIFFTFFPKDLRLDRSDAIFVDVIHTADEYPLPKGFGFYKPCGDLDFYPNGGLFQPGCNSTIPIEQMPTTSEEFLARNCMHWRAVIYYIESMCNRCTFIGTMCENYEKFEKGLCNALVSRTAVMGEFATKPLIEVPEDAMFFLDTNDHYPFCKIEEEQQYFILKEVLYFFLTFFKFVWSLLLFR